MKSRLPVFVVFLFFGLITACTQDEDISNPNDLIENTTDGFGAGGENDPENPPAGGADDNSSDDTSENSGGADSQPSGCTDPTSIVFQESNALLMIEFEDGAFENNSQWELINDGQVSGGMYAVWEGNDLFNAPGSGLVTFQLNIQNPGIYRFTWNSAVTKGNNGTEHNDSWIRFPDAADFYGEKNGSKVYPKDTGKTPNPNGASKEGWFKAYRSGNDLSFKWQARTSDNDAHDIYVEFETTGVYTMEVSGRSSGHGIDRFVLFQEAVYSKNEATSVTDFSEIDCN